MDLPSRRKVERNFAHLMRRKHGGRRARMRGPLRIAHDFALLEAAAKLARLTALGVPIVDPTSVLTSPEALPRLPKLPTRRPEAIVGPIGRKVGVFRARPSEASAESRGAYFP